MTPGIYTSKSVLFSYDWASVAKTYPLWVAQHPNYERRHRLGSYYSIVQARVNEMLA